MLLNLCVFFFFQAEDGIRDYKVTGVQTCALPIFEPIVRRRIEDDRLDAGLRHREVVEFLERGDVDLGERSEERRVGKEWRSEWWPSDKYKKHIVISILCGTVEKRNRRHKQAYEEG